MATFAHGGLHRYDSHIQNYATRCTDNASRKAVAARGAPSKLPDDPATMISVVRTTEPMIARSASILWWSRVYLGSKFGDLTAAEQDATVAHECGHCALHHMELRTLALIFTPWRFKKVCRNQEFKADAFASRMGHGVALAKLISRIGSDGPYHPSANERIIRLARRTLHANPARTA